jgi:capsular polysaccharide biosynthesis protein
MSPSTHTLAPADGIRIRDVADNPLPVGTDFWTSVDVVRRHWKLLLVGLVLTFALAWGAFVAVGPSYQATTEMILLVPHGNTTPGRTADVLPTGNPYLSFGGTLNVTGTVIAKALMGNQGATEVSARGGSASYSVEPPVGDAPVLTITATSADPAASLRTAAIVRTLLTRELDRQQRVAGAPQASWITMAPLEVADHATPQKKSQIRALAAILVLGTAGSVGMCFFAESLAQRRRGRQQWAQAFAGDAYGEDEYGEDEYESAAPEEDEYESAAPEEDEYESAALEQDQPDEQLDEEHAEAPDGSRLVLEDAAHHPGQAWTGRQYRMRVLLDNVEASDSDETVPVSAASR